MRPIPNRAANSVTVSHLLGVVGAVKGTRQPSLFDDRIEAREGEYHRRVRQGYLDQAAAEPDRHFVVDSSGDEDEVFAQLLGGL